MNAFQMEPHIRGSWFTQVKSLNSDDMFLWLRSPSLLNEKSAPSIFTIRKPAVCLNGFLLPRTSSTQLLICCAFL